MNKKIGVVAISAATKLSIIFSLLVLMLAYLFFLAIFIWQFFGFLSGIGIFAATVAFQFPLRPEDGLAMFIFLKIIICVGCFLLLRGLYKKIKLLEAEYDTPIEKTFSDASKTIDRVGGDLKSFNQKLGNAIGENKSTDNGAWVEAAGSRFNCPTDKIVKVGNFAVNANEFWHHFSEANAEMSDIERRMHFDNCYAHFVSTILGIENPENVLNLEPKVKAQFVKYMLS
jgi:hypothetical protein